MISIKEYVDRMFKNVPVNENTESIKQEIIQNLQEKVMDLMENGKEEEDAVNKAIIDFGDFEEIKTELMSAVQSVKAEVKSPRRSYRKITNALLFAICGSIIFTALMVFINFYYSPGRIWFVYPLFGIIWWPLSLFFVWLGKRDKR